MVGKTPQWRSMDLTSMGKLSTANENHNIRNIIWNAQGWKIGMFVEIGQIYSLDWTWKVATQVIYTPFVFAFMTNLKKETHIEDMEILLSLRIWSITPNARMTQTPNISCGATHQGWSKKISKYQYWMVYTLEIKWTSMMKTLCVWGFICGYSPCGVSWPIFILRILNS